MVEFTFASLFFCSAELELEPFVVGADFFYKLVDETAWMSSRVILLNRALFRKISELITLSMWPFFFKY